MKIELKIHEKMLLELLRAALNEVPAKTALFEAATKPDWIACYRFAIEQGTMALAWDGITTLPSQLMPPKDLKINWYLKVEAYEKRYLTYCQTATHLSQYYKSHGIETLFLKGVGFSTNYPKPHHREGGDIDIYTYSNNPANMSHMKANALADELMRQKGIAIDTTSKKHSSFYYHGIPIENHHTFLDIDKWEIAIPMEKQLKKELLPISIKLEDEKDEIVVPSETFNTLFISFHTLLHYGAGICLHHLCDWACLLNQSGLHLPKEVTETHYLQFVATLTAFTNQYLGTQVPVNYSEEALDKLVYEMFRSPYNHYRNDISNPLKVIVYKAQHIIYYSKILKEIAGIPFSRSLWNSLMRIVDKPSKFIRL